MYACMHACMHGCTYVCMYVRMYVCMYVCMCMYRCVTLVVCLTICVPGVCDVIRMCMCVCEVILFSCDARLGGSNVNVYTRKYTDFDACDVKI